MMYHFDVSCGESPDFATVKDTPPSPYVGLPCGVKLSDSDEKSMSTVLPSAESGGQLLEVVGLQFVYVCAAEGATRNATEARAATALAVDRIMVWMWMWMRRKEGEELLRMEAHSESATATVVEIVGRVSN
jgi:hypothetical protein